MSKYKETLDVLLKFYDEHPDKSADEIVALVAKELQLDEQTLAEIKESNDFIVAADENFNELQQAKKKHISVKAWIMKKVKAITDLVKTEEEKNVIANTIGNALEQSIDNQKD
ncbi:MAG: hypothetical protein MJZ33_07640 [Paludibacteraceae bacterium]|nr:hypothetical protein [Paludibacteraceae bacterium]